MADAVNVITIGKRKAKNDTGADKKMGAKKKGKEKAAKPTESRRRNWTSEEIGVLIKEASARVAVIKGRYGPSVTCKEKEKCWQKITGMINAVNGHNDREWTRCRSKYQDLESSTRIKARKQMVERKKTGGGVTSADPFTAAEAIAMEHIPQSVIKGG